ncbi:TPA: polyketide cyclase [Candidatus Uhrbacteria bacterium]|nr:polyketide cyclase [Candidatus Uhrbacteria bacterium]
MIILALIIGFVIALTLSLYAQPDIFKVERHLQISATPEDIFPFIDDLKNWSAWSPWEKKDADMRKNFAGPNHGAGATYDWQGNKQVGEGKMTIIRSTAPHSVVIDLEFIKPFANHNTTTFTLVPDGTKTLVTWSMSGPNVGFMRIMHAVCNMDTMIGNDFVLGLNNLKAVVEK